MGLGKEGKLTYSTSRCYGDRPYFARFPNQELHGSPKLGMQSGR